MSPLCGFFRSFSVFYQDDAALAAFHCRDEGGALCFFGEPAVKVAKPGGFVLFGVSARRLKPGFRRVASALQPLASGLQPVASRFRRALRTYGPLLRASGALLWLTTPFYSGNELRQASLISQPKYTSHGISFIGGSSREAETSGRRRFDFLGEPVVEGGEARRLRFIRGFSQEAETRGLKLGNQETETRGAGSGNHIAGRFSF